MNWLYAAVRFLPYWSLPIIFISIEMAWSFRRKGRGLQWQFWAIALILGATTGAWFFFRGDLNSDQWVREFLLALAGRAE